MDQVQVEPVQVDAVQVDDPAQPVNDVQVDDHVPHVDVQMDGPAQTINDVPAQPVAIGKRIQNTQKELPR